MEPRYRTLRTLYDIVKNDPQPTTYPCRPREIILRLMTDWNIIIDYLQELEKEECIVTRQLDTLVINITKTGIERAMALTKDKTV